MVAKPSFQDTKDATYLCQYFWGKKIEIVICVDEFDLKVTHISVIFKIV